jgi:hypothetical protein
MKLDDLSVVGVSPFGLVDIRIKVIVPSFTTCNNNTSTQNMRITYKTGK